MALFGRKTEVPEENDDANVNDDADEGEGQEEPKQFVTVDQMQEMINANAAAMTTNLAQLLQPPPVAPAAPAMPEFTAEVSDEEMALALEEQDHRKVIKLQKQQRLRDKQISEFEMNKLRSEGAQWIGSVNQKMAEEKLPGYDKHKKKIDSILSTFPEQVRGDSDVIKFVYNSVRGENIEEEIEATIKAREDAKKRQANLEPTGDPSPRRAAGNGRGYEDEESYFSNAVDDTLRAVGRTREDHAQKLGYASWEEYEATAKAYDEKPIHRWATKG